jgi:protein TonB
MMTHCNRVRRLLPAFVLMAGLGGCGIFAPGSKTAESGAPGPGPAQAAQDESAHLVSAQTPAVRAYRKIGARHIYSRYASRIYKGKIPPLVYAVVTVETQLDATGRVEAVSFMRAPEQAPEVAPKIAELIKAASPLPAPGKVGAHTYVETWLWDKSGKFQLDSITQGQRSR